MINGTGVATALAALIEAAAVISKAEAAQPKAGGSSRRSAVHVAVVSTTDKCAQQKARSVDATTILQQYAEPR